MQVILQVLTCSVFLAAIAHAVVLMVCTGWRYTLAWYDPLFPTMFSAVGTFLLYVTIADAVLIQLRPEEDLDSGGYWLIIIFGLMMPMAMAGALSTIRAPSPRRTLSKVSRFVDHSLRGALLCEKQARMIPPPPAHAVLVCFPGRSHGHPPDGSGQAAVVQGSLQSAEFPEWFTAWGCDGGTPSCGIAGDVVRATKPLDLFMPPPAHVSLLPGNPKGCELECTRTPPLDELTRCTRWKPLALEGSHAPLAAHEDHLKSRSRFFLFCVFYVPVLTT